MRRRVPTGTASKVCMEFRNQLQQVIACIAPGSYFRYTTDASEEVAGLTSMSIGAAECGMRT
jgi:hypothetical protein